MKKLTKLPKKPLGLFLGRFQPPHIGHEMGVREIIHRGYEPGIILGSADKMDIKNPLSVELRKQCWQEILKDYGYQHPIIAKVSDYDEDIVWAEKVAILVGNIREMYERDVCVFTYPKHGEVDIRKILHKIPVNTLHWPTYTKFDINSTLIRNDFERFSLFLSPKVHFLVKITLQMPKILV